MYEYVKWIVAKQYVISLTFSYPGEELSNNGWLKPHLYSDLYTKLALVDMQSIVIFDQQWFGLCVVVALSKIPQQTANRLKNDKRDGLSLARLHIGQVNSHLYTS